MHKNEKIIEKVLAQLKKETYVEGVLLFGSAARDITAEHQDIDFFVLINQDWRQHKVIREDEIPIELFYFPFYGFIDHFEKDEKMFYLQMILLGKILYDKKGDFKALQDEAKKIFQEKIEFDEDALNSFIYHLEDIETDIALSMKGDPVNVHYLLDHKIQFILKSYFRLQGIPEPKFTSIIYFLKEHNEELYQLLNSYYTTHDLSKKHEISKTMENMILQQLKDPNLFWNSKKVYYHQIPKKESSKNRIKNIRKKRKPFRK